DGDHRSRWTGPRLQCAVAVGCRQLRPDLRRGRVLLERRTRVVLRRGADRLHNRRRSALSRSAADQSLRLFHLPRQLTMSDVRRLSNFISRTVSGPMWHGQSLSELLTDISAEDAAAHPIAGAHSIWEIVLHMASWAEIGRARL